MLSAQSENSEHSESLLPPEDHRAIAARLDLVHFQDDAPAMAFWHPRGWQLYRALEAAARAHIERAGYREVRSPQLLRRAIWQRSGHWGAFADGMFALADGSAALKPVSCPAHIEIVRRMAPSWRDLPLRIGELGLVHRDEPAGSVHGLMRLRQFCQDDGHIFCAVEHVHAEVAKFCRDIVAFYRAFGIADADVEVALSLRPANRIGDDAIWDRAEAALADAAASAGLSPIIQPGAGAIYGPKLEWMLRDHRGRSWQCGTIQVDFLMAERFELGYVAADGARRPLVMLHRAMYGSIERFMALLLERCGGALPAWLAPEQVAIVPIGPAHAARAGELRAALVARGVRAIVAPHDESVSRRIAAAHHGGVPLCAIVGDRELASGSVSVRARDAQVSLAWDPAIAELASRCRAPDFATSAG